MGWKEEKTKKVLRNQQGVNREDKKGVFKGKLQQ